MNRMQLRLLVAKALRQLHDPLLLADSPLVRILGIVARGDPAEAGEGLRGRLCETSQSVMARLAGGRWMRMRRELLRAVVGGSSVAAWARRAGLSREHVCRTLWIDVTSLVAREPLQAELCERRCTITASRALLRGPSNAGPADRCVRDSGRAG